MEKVKKTEEEWKQELSPEQFQEYQDRYFQSYRPAIHALADVLKTDVAAHRRPHGRWAAMFSRT